MCLSPRIFHALLSQVTVFFTHYSRRRRICSRIIRACFRACFHAWFRECFRAFCRAGFRACFRAGICACFRACIRAGFHAGFCAGVRAGFSRRVFTQGFHAGVHAHGGRVPGVLPPAAAVPSAAAPRCREDTPRRRDAAPWWRHAVHCCHDAGSCFIKLDFQNKG